MFERMLFAVITVSDLERSVAFYTRYLNLTVRGEPMEFGPEVAEGQGLGQVDGIVSRGVMLGWDGSPEGSGILLVQYLQPRDDAAPPAGARGLGVACLSLHYAGDIDEFHERLASEGVAFISPPVQTGNGRWCFMIDPDGTRLQVVVPS